MQRPLSEFKTPLMLNKQVSSDKRATAVQRARPTSVTSDSSQN